MHTADTHRHHFWLEPGTHLGESRHVLLLIVRSWICPSCTKCHCNQSIKPSINSFAKKIQQCVINKSSYVGGLQEKATAHQAGHAVTRGNYVSAIFDS